ncbi:MAG TPA: hypothetical protein VN702_16550 [Acetobacteraceae bacterium]|nr:hypothetical protein [Acetobacteraceae bacterium]
MFLFPSMLDRIEAGAEFTNPASPLAGDTERGPGPDRQLHEALTEVAARSPRFQADVHAAMRGHNLSLTPEQLDAALRRLEERLFIRDRIVLSDGGILVTVAVGMT